MAGTNTDVTFSISVSREQVDVLPSKNQALCVSKITVNLLLINVL